MARKEDYVSKIHDKQIKRLIGMDYTDEQAAQHMGICATTLWAWKNKHPTFLKAYEQGKYEPIKKVTGSAYKRANGYNVEEEVYEVIYPEENKGKKGKNGKPMGRKKLPQKRLVRVTTKHIPPDPTMLKFVLTNKDKAKWQDSSKIELGGQMEYIVAPPVVPKPDDTNKKGKK